MTRGSQQLVVAKPSKAVAADVASSDGRASVAKKVAELCQGRASEGARCGDFSGISRAEDFDDLLW